MQGGFGNLQQVQPNIYLLSDISAKVSIYLHFCQQNIIFFFQSPTNITVNPIHEINKYMSDSICRCCAVRSRISHLGTCIETNRSAPYAKVCHDHYYSVRPNKDGKTWTACVTRLLFAQLAAQATTIYNKAVTMPTRQRVEPLQISRQNCLPGT